MTTQNVCLLYNVQYRTNNWFIVETERAREREKERERVKEVIGVHNLCLSLKLYNA